MLGACVGVGGGGHSETIKYNTIGETTIQKKKLEKTVGATFIQSSNRKWWQQMKKHFNVFEVEVSSMGRNCKSC